MKLYFYHRSKGIIPRLIHHFTGYWDHVGVQADGFFYESLGGRPMGVNGIVIGTNYMSYHRGKVKADHVVSVELNLSQEQQEKALKFLREQVGNSYDYGAIATYIPFVRLVTRGKESARYCSEYMAEMLAYVFDLELNAEYTPTEILDICLALGGIKEVVYNESK